MSQPPQNLEIVDEIFMPNSLMLIAPKHHKLSKLKNIELNALVDEKFIFREKGSGTRMATELHFRKNKFIPNVLLELGSNEAIKESVAGGLGLAVLSDHSIGKQYMNSGVVVLNCKNFPIQSNWHIVTPKGKRSSLLSTAFKEHLLKSI
jgi:DNA-binding transcriptional LysR family regulator